MPSIFDAPARLKSIELQGYKTFASKTEFAFAPTITAIVGPNGVGKSNIADAIRWVLGEQSYRLLRAKRTEDVIFTGSEKRSRAGMAAATIIFDNSDGWLPIDFNEVSISRRAYRDGNNEYLLNGQRVRLRDVVELLAECGLAERTYTIIGQGLVDAALSLRAEERRRLFEEAAGIGLYRIRRQEAERRLDATQRNLERAQDILSELRPRLRSLERQARRARNHEQVRTDLKEALRIWYGYHWHKMQSDVVTRRTAARNQETKRDDLRSRHERADRELVEARRRIDGLRSDLHRNAREVSGLYGQREIRGRRLAVAQERERWLGDQEKFLQAEITTLEDRRQVIRERLQHAQREAQRRQEAVTTAKYSLEQPVSEDQDEQRTMLASRMRELQTSQERLIADRAAWEAQSTQLNARADALGERRTALHGDVSAAETLARDAERQALDAEKRLQTAREELEKQETALASARSKVEEKRVDQERLERDAAKIKTEQDSVEARLDALQRSLEDSERVAKSMIQASASGELGGLAGKLGDALKIEPAYQVAIAALLGSFAPGVAFETGDDVGEALRWLAQRNDGDPAALLPLSLFHEPSLIEAPRASGCLGNAAELVETSKDYRELANMLLGRAWVVEDHETAQRLRIELPPDGRLVTLAGEVFYASGAVMIGADHPASAAGKRLAELETKLAALKGKSLDSAQEAQRAAEETKQAEDRFGEAQQNLEDTRRAEGEAQLHAEKMQLAKQDANRTLAFLKGQLELLETEIDGLEQQRREMEGKGATYDLERESIDAELGIIQSQLRPEGDEWVEFGSPLDVAAQAEQQARSRLSEVEHERNALEHELQNWKHRLASNQKEQEELRAEIEDARRDAEEVEQQLQELTAQVRPAEQALTEAEDKRAQLEAEESLTRSLLQEAERGHSQLQIELARREEELSSLRRRIEDDFGLVAFEDQNAIASQEPLPLQGLVERLPRVEDLPLDLQTQMGRLKAQLRRMGAINPEAQSEYEEVRARVDFLTQQLEDSQKAATQIREVIAELDVLMEREFRKTFEAVAKEFRETFTRLFGGGSARLILTDMDDFSNSGIDIEARLPGRRSQGLAALSGGERSLTATSLIFSLLKISPTPFCVLDEVDAMLDEANVVRFIDMLRELSRETQFILITHNRQTVQAAEVIYGVSMGADSASRVISLRLDEAIKQVSG
ncbi:MAG TPA: chromosome segregation protein SMC [Anaerolineae bacterium]|nr:chromosome segregation protein SMC [Anaerolineae bacterium]